MFGNFLHPGAQGVKSSRDIPRGTVLGPCPVEVCLYLGATDLFQDNGVEVDYTNGHITGRGTPLQTTLQNPLHTVSGDWMLFVQAARDNHEQNLELVQHGANFFVVVTKQVMAGDRLLVWYSPEFARTLDIPVLRPENIEANNRYVCRRCKQSYGYPNSLKSHLRLCNHLSSQPYLEQNANVPLLWQPWLYQQQQQASQHLYNYLYEALLAQNLHFRAIKANKSDASNVSPKTQQLLKEPPLLIPDPRLSLAFGRSSVETNLAHKLCSPRKETQPAKCNDECQRYPSQVLDPIHSHLAMTKFRIPPPEEVVGEPLDVLPLYACLHEKGHICVYCGKLYSRKYGLKIHLRTHTGYKPLKCKVCFRSFGDPSNLNKHIRLHAQGQSPYKCNHCNKILVRRRDLERHVKARHADRKDGVALTETLTIDVE